MDQEAYAEFLSQIKIALGQNDHKFDERGDSLVLKTHAEPADVFGILPEHDRFMAMVEEINQGRRRKSTIVKIVPKADGAATGGDAPMKIKKELGKRGKEKRYWSY
ncbi:hypothetical protein HY095_02655 [Candidatus Micrarchaeota archaeon]|nr:hypothetical protein [Candidatus Micrarchaeota archaeon]